MTDENKSVAASLWVCLQRMRAHWREPSFDLDVLKGRCNVHLGCGRIRMDGFINVDRNGSGATDLLADLTSPLPFATGEVNLIFADNVLEHIAPLPALILECHRVLAEGGHLVARVPYFRSPSAFVDPTHCTFFTLQSFDYYVADRHAHRRVRFFDETFADLKVYPNVGSHSPGDAVLRSAAMASPWFYEKSLVGRLFPFHNLTFVLTK